MQTCTHKDAKGIRCRLPVLTKPDKSIPSERISMPGKAGEFIYLHTQRLPISNLCYYHQMLADQKRFESDRDKERNKLATKILKGF